LGGELYCLKSLEILEEDMGERVRGKARFLSFEMVPCLRSTYTEEDNLPPAAS